MAASIQYSQGLPCSLVLAAGHTCSLIRAFAHEQCRGINYCVMEDQKDADRATMPDGSASSGFWAACPASAAAPDRWAKRTSPSSCTAFWSVPVGRRLCFEQNHI